MRFFRTSEFSQALAVALVLSVASLLWAPMQSTVDTSTDHSTWLRAQAKDASDPAFEEALDRAQETQPQSLSHFLEAFALAFEELAPDASLGHVFSVPHLSVDALLMYLQTRSTGAAADALSPRVFLVPHKLAPNPAPDRALAASLLVPQLVAYTRLVQHEALRAAPRVVTPLRSLFSAMPMAP